MTAASAPPLTCAWSIRFDDDHRATDSYPLDDLRCPDDMRPVTDRTDAMAELRAILSAREPLYAQAGIRVDTSAGSLEAAVATLVSRVAGRSGAAYGS